MCEADQKSLFSRPHCVRTMLEDMLGIVYCRVPVVVDCYGDKVKLYLKARTMYRHVARRRTAQCASLLLVDALVGRLPPADMSSLDLYEVERIPALSDDVYLVVPNTPVALDDVETLLAQPLHGGILAPRTRTSLLLAPRAYASLLLAHRAYLRLMRKSIFSPGCTS